MRFTDIQRDPYMHGLRENPAAVTKRTEANPEGREKRQKIEEEENDSQALWIGVRPVWYDDQPGEVMIQICYQELYMAGPLAGPVWLTPETWEQVKEAVDWRLKHRKGQDNA